MAELRSITPELIVQTARAWINTPYHHQSATRGAGCDCLGLVRGVFFDLHGFHPELPPAYTQTWGEYGKEELMMEAARRNLVTVSTATVGHVLPIVDQLWQPGDVLLFRARLGAVAKHCGIVSGEDTMIHSYSGYGVRETSIGIWGSRTAGVFKFPGL
jgi:NlpC/P60 family putative phage cell wall peptidase